MREGETQGTIIVKNASKMGVLGEARNLEAPNGHFHDAFRDYDVHLYEIMDVHE